MRPLRPAVWICDGRVFPDPDLLAEAVRVLVHPNIFSRPQIDSVAVRSVGSVNVVGVRTVRNVVRAFRGAQCPAPAALVVDEDAPCADEVGMVICVMALYPVCPVRSSNEKFSLMVAREYLVLSGSIQKRKQLDHQPPVEQLSIPLRAVRTHTQLGVWHPLCSYAKYHLHTPHR